MKSYSEFPLRTDYQKREAENQARADRQKTALRITAGAVATGAVLSLASMGGGEAQPQKAPDPTAPAEDVAQRPDGSFVEIADEKYRQELPADPSQMTVEVEPSTGERE